LDKAGKVRSSPDFFFIPLPLYLSALEVSVPQSPEVAYFERYARACSGESMPLLETVLILVTLKEPFDG
jgi:hypothetical protein